MSQNNFNSLIKIIIFFRQLFFKSFTLYKIFYIKKIAIIFVSYYYKIDFFSSPEQKRETIMLRWFLHCNLTIELNPKIWGWQSSPGRFLSKGKWRFLFTHLDAVCEWSTIMASLHVRARVRAAAFTFPGKIACDPETRTKYNSDQFSYTACRLETHLKNDYFIF